MKKRNTKRGIRPSQYKGGLTSMMEYSASDDTAVRIEDDVRLLADKYKSFHLLHIAETEEAKAIFKRLHNVGTKLGTWNNFKPDHIYLFFMVDRPDAQKMADDASKLLTGIEMEATGAASLADNLAKM